MAKVYGPLMSLEASGKLGKAVVFFTWKGINVVRRWIKPYNPQSAGQVTVRDALSVVGKGINWANLTALVAAGETLTDKMLVKALNLPAGVPWNAYLAQSALGSDLAAYDDASAAWTALAGGEKTAWDNAAAALVPAMETYKLQTAGDVFFHYRWGLYLLGICTIPNATPPTYA